MIGGLLGSTMQSVKNLFRQKTPTSPQSPKKNFELPKISEGKEQVFSSSNVTQSDSSNAGFNQTNKNNSKNNNKAENKSLLSTHAGITLFVFFLCVSVCVCVWFVLLC